MGDELSSLIEENYVQKQQFLERIQKLEAENMALLQQLKSKS